MQRSFSSSINGLNLRILQIFKLNIIKNKLNKSNHKFSYFVDQNFSALDLHDPFPTMTPPNSSLIFNDLKFQRNQRRRISVKRKKTDQKARMTNQQPPKTN
ncbi:hypothetical protein BpHYR1_006247 [Brachionus plicatilis]|uniref:Uncharacterized protein n=1 Tax=Brachionus plicatilis TaxID=10195 RepID=A0A3M7SYS4_BRAPC|nr:hypothetical protein BpHYR1_006247 [Brachionus plicatilis]